MRFPSTPSASHVQKFAALSAVELTSSLDMMTTRLPPPGLEPGTYSLRDTVGGMVASFSRRPFLFLFQLKANRLDCVRSRHALCFWGYPQIILARL